MRTLTIAFVIAMTPWLPVQDQVKEAMTIKADGPVFCVAFSGDAKTLAFAGKGRTVRVWDVATRTEKAVLKGHIFDVMSVVLSRDGSQVVSGDYMGLVKQWDLKVGKEKATFQAHSAVCSLALSADESLLATVGIDALEIGNYGLPTVRMREIGSGKERALANSDFYYMTSAAFSPDSNLLAAGNFKGEVNLWTVANGKTRATLKHSDNQHVTSIAFSPDGRMLASASTTNDDASGSIKLWEVATLMERAKFEGHDDSVFSVKFSPDGKLLASGCKDGNVRLWDTSTCKVRAALKGHGGTVLSVAFSPDGKLLASGSRDGTVKLWDMSAFAVLSNNNAKD